MTTKQPTDHPQATITVEDFANCVIHDCLACDTELGIRLDLELRIKPHSFYYYVRKNKEVMWKGSQLDIAVAEYNKLYSPVNAQLPPEDQFYVRYTEYESGYNSRDAGSKGFNSREEALAHTEEYNNKNLDKDEAPDWFIRADYVGRKP